MTAELFSESAEVGPEATFETVNYILQSRLAEASRLQKRNPDSDFFRQQRYLDVAEEPLGIMLLASTKDYRDAFGGQADAFVVALPLQEANVTNPVVDQAVEPYFVVITQNEGAKRFTRVQADNYEPLFWTDTPEISNFFEKIVNYKLVAIGQRG